jgi:hypothetical protein
VLARSKRRKGSRLETFVASRLAEICPARKQPGSGIYNTDFPQDVMAVLTGRRWIIECKSWANGWRTGDKAMGAAEILVIKADRSEPRVYMHWDAFAELVRAANAGNDTAAEALPLAPGAKP